VVGALVAFASSILVFSSKSGGVLGSVLELPLLRKIGVWSFSIYLLHLVCFEVAGNIATYGFGLDLKHGIGASAWLWDAATLGVVLVLARSTYQRVEEPLRNFVKERVTETAPGASPALAPVGHPLPATTAISSARG
jgi:peptidoglycan/LPS O-acetylase OafA/YrhL